MLSEKKSTKNPILDTIELTEIKNFILAEKKPFLFIRLVKTKLYIRIFFKNLIKFSDDNVKQVHFPPQLFKTFSPKILELKLNKFD